MNKTENLPMSMTRLVTLALLALIPVEPAFAKHDFYAMREHRTEDKGCPAGSYSIVTSPDGSSISVLFDKFAVEGNEANGGFSRISCAMEIPLHLPDGYSLGVYKADYRGYARLEQRQRAELQVDYGVGERNRGRRFRKEVKGVYDGDYAFNERLGGGILKRVGCGDAAVLNFTASLTLMSKKGSTTGQMVLDSVDGSPAGGLVFGLDLRKCGGRNANDLEP
jgi:hypothetical protein